MLPEHLKIGYEIVRVSTGTKDFELQGEFDAQTGTIIVAANGTPRRRLATLMHEILHACWDQAEMGDLADHDREEQIVNRLSTILTAVLLDNPQLRQTIDEAAGADNGTCRRPRTYAWQEAHVTLPKMPNQFAEAVERMVKIELEQQERELNEPMLQRGSEPRNEPKLACCVSVDDCRRPNCACYHWT